MILLLFLVLDDQLTLLLAMEKKCRVSSDLTNLVLVSKYMVKLCRDRGDWYEIERICEQTLIELSQVKAQRYTRIN